MKKPFLLIPISIFLLPFVVRPAIASEIWIFAIFGLGANLSGYNGRLSFGQSTFFGSAAYVAGWMMKRTASTPSLRSSRASVWRALGCGGWVPVRAALGPILHHAHLCAKPALLLHRLPVDQRHWRRGRHAGVPRPALASIDFKDPLIYYAFVSLLFLLALFLMKRITESPLGKILQAIRENEVRAEAVGYDVPRFKRQPSSSAAPSRASRACSTLCCSASCR